MTQKLPACRPAKQYQPAYNLNHMKKKHLLPLCVALLLPTLNSYARCDPNQPMLSGPKSFTEFFLNHRVVMQATVFQCPTSELRFEISSDPAGPLYFGRIDKQQLANGTQVPIHVPISKGVKISGYLTVTPASETQAGSLRFSGILTPENPMLAPRYNDVIIARWQP